MRTYGAAFVGTFWLVLGGCGSAVLEAAVPDVGIGVLYGLMAAALTEAAMTTTFLSWAAGARP